MPNQHEAQPVVGHHAGWGLVPSSSRVRPYTLTPGATEIMSVRVREKIDIQGVGTDVVEMAGIFIVRRDHACPCPTGDHSAEPQWGNCIISTEFRALELYGESRLFGTVRVHLDPAHVSNGEVGPATEGSLAAQCVAHCHATFELPELGLNLTTGGTAIELASKVVQVPPVGDVARSENSASLLDEAGNIVGELISSDIEVGEVLFSIPLGNTGRRDTPHQERADAAHTHGAHSSPFFAESPDKLPAVSMPHSPQPATTAGRGIEAVLARLESELTALTELVRDLAHR